MHFLSLLLNCLTFDIKMIEQRRIRKEKKKIEEARKLHFVLSHIHDEIKNDPPDIQAKVIVHTLRYYDEFERTVLGERRVKHNDRNSASKPRACGFSTKSAPAYFDQRPRRYPGVKLDNDRMSYYNFLSQKSAKPKKRANDWNSKYVFPKSRAKNGVQCGAVSSKSWCNYSEKSSRPPPRMASVRFPQSKSSIKISNFQTQTQSQYNFSSSSDNSNSIDKAKIINHRYYHKAAIETSKKTGNILTQKTIRNPKVNFMGNKDEITPITSIGSYTQVRDSVFTQNREENDNYCENGTRQNENSGGNFVLQKLNLLNNQTQNQTNQKPIQPLQLQRNNTSRLSISYGPNGEIIPIDLANMDYLQKLKHLAEINKKLNANMENGNSDSSEGSSPDGKSSSDNDAFFDDDSGDGGSDNKNDEDDEEYYEYGMVKEGDDVIGDDDPNKKYSTDDSFG